MQDRKKGIIKQICTYTQKHMEYIYWAYVPDDQIDQFSYMGLA